MTESGILSPNTICSLSFRTMFRYKIINKTKPTFKRLNVL